MKIHTKILSLAALLAASSPLALADSVGQISISGGNTFTTSAITFSDPYITTGDTGVFSGLNGGTVTFAASSWNFAGGTSATPTLLYSITNGDETADFYVSGDTYSMTPYSNDVGETELSLMINGTGMFSGNFFSGEMPASFNITSQGEAALGGSSTQQVSFSGTGDAVAAAVTPEPNSLVLFATGLLGAASLLFVRRRQPRRLS